jgi:hypothetical protein
MADFPSWDFWKFKSIEDDGIKRQISIHEWDDIGKRDIRNKQYDLDYDSWCRKHFWDAEEAAAISFGRDPGKITESLKDGPITANEDEDFTAHDELADQMVKRLRLIEKAQENGQLTKDFFRPSMFIEWGRRMGFYVPPRVEKWLGNVERERRGEGTISRTVPGIFFENEAEAEQVSKTDSEAEQASKTDSDKGWKKVGSGTKQYDNNLLRILLAVMIESKLIDRDPRSLSKTLATLMEKRKIRKPTGQFIDEQTIYKRLLDVHDVRAESS